MPRDLVVRETRCKSALTRVKGMPFEWSLNPFLGCSHSCVYCYAREYHARRERDPGEGFDREIDVKVNFAPVLRVELARMRERPGFVALGTATDPYQPAEGGHRITRATLQVLRDFAVPVSIVTKSPLVVRDIDLLSAIDERTAGGARVLFSVCNLNLELWREIEPGTARPLQRLEAMRRLRSAGIDAGVLCAPILPGLSDSEGALDAVARAAARYGATSFGWRVLKLDPHVKELYFSFLAAEFPVLLPAYESGYERGAYADPAYVREIDARVERVRSRYGFDARGRTEAVRDPEQLKLAV